MGSPHHACHQARQVSEDPWRFKLTFNQASKLDRYPIPRIDDLFATREILTKLDMSQAFQQILLDEESKSYVVINTHKGLFRYNLLPFGVSSAPGIFLSE